jgi:hypothetical protein
MFDPLIHVLSQTASSVLTILILVLQIMTTVDWLRERRWEKGSQGWWLVLIWMVPFGGLFYLMDKESKKKKQRSMPHETRQEQQELQRRYQEGYQVERSTQRVAAPSTFSYDQPQASYPELPNPEQLLQQR